MVRTQTIVQLNDRLVEELDAEAARRGLSRSALVREALEQHLAEQRERSIGQQIADGYRRIPPATPDEWGHLEPLADEAAAELLHRLDAEERQQGHGPW